MKNFALLVFLAVGTVPALAQISSTGPFSGTTSEGFESFDTYQVGHYSTMSVMGGNATINSLPAAAQHMAVFGGTAQWGLGVHGLASVHEGERALGIEDIVAPSGNQDIEIVFGTAVSAFGGYFASTPSVATLKFYDAGNVQIGADQQIVNGDNSNSWFGWESTIAIARIEIQSIDSYLAMDELQANPVPEPATMALLAAGAAIVAKRRRK